MTFRGLDQAASFWFALTDTWRGGAPPHLRPHTCSRQLCVLPPVTAPAPPGPADSRGSRPGHKRPSHSKRHPLRRLRRRSPQARPGPTRRSSSCLIRRRKHYRQASNGPRLGRNRSRHRRFGRPSLSPVVSRRVSRLLCGDLFRASPFTRVPASPRFCFEAAASRSWAVRLLIYRPPDDDARVQKRARNRLKRADGAVLSKKFVISL
jgi:hypothetical protein